MNKLPFTSKGATFTCPRRFEAMPLDRWPREVPLADRYTTGHGIVGQDQVGTSCSYCGSLNPNVFMAKVRDGWHVGGSDKSYKFYLQRPMTQEAMDAHRRAYELSSVGMAIATAAREEGRDPDEALFEQYNKVAFWETRGQTVAKFYTLHLNRAQCQEFIDLWQAKRLNHSMYVTPALPALSELAPPWMVGDEF